MVGRSTFLADATQFCLPIELERRGLLRECSLQSSLLLQQVRVILQVSWGGEGGWLPQHVASDVLGCVALSLSGNAHGCQRLKFIGSCIGANVGAHITWFVWKKVFGASAQHPT